MMHARVSAESDLPWYYGTGSQTAMGDAGLRSPMGPQLDAMRSGLLRDQSAVDSSRSEDQAISRLFVAHRYGAIRARLQALSDEDQAVLMAHYREKPLPFGVSAAACILRQMHRDALSDLLRATKGRELALSLEVAALGRVARARAAYESARIPKVRMVRAW